MDIDDDYNDYSEEEEFNEDSLTNEEYDALHEALPKAKQALSSYNSDIDELAIKEALYFHYFELEAALEELREKFPKKKGMFNSFPPASCYTGDSLSSRLLIHKTHPPNSPNLLC